MEGLSIFFCLLILQLQVITKRKACVVEVAIGIRRDVRMILTLSGFQRINVESALHYC